MHRDPIGEPPSDQHPPAERRQSPAALLRRQDFAHAAPKLAYEDPLTGTHNRRLLDHLFNERWPQLTGAHDEMALVVVDVDSFKEVNDGYGHLTGDEVLKVAAELLSRSFRHEDFLIRYGGDEFVVIAPGSGVEAARGLTRQAREALEDYSFVAEDGDRPVELKLSFSIGVASFPHDGTTGEALLRAADQRLYRDKRKRHGATREAAGPGRPTTGRTLALATAAALVIVVGTTVLLQSGAGVDPSTPPEPVEVTAESIPVPAPSGPDPERLKAQIRSLAKEVRALTEERSDRQQAEYERRIHLLEARIQQLQAQLAKQSETAAERDVTIDGVTSAAIDVPSAGGAPAGDAPVSKSDEAPANAAATAAPPSASEVGRDNARSPPAASPELITVPKLIRFHEPEYPRAARRLRRQAKVELRLLVDADGTVLSAEPIGPKAGLGFEAAARQAAFRARFEPGTRNGIPVVMETSLRIRFRLNL